MRSIPTSIHGTLVTAVILLLVLGCNDDISYFPPPTVTLDELWPNDDGHEWNYDGTVRIWHESESDTLYPSAETVPPMPPLTELAERLVSPLAEPDSTYSSLFSLQLDGINTTTSGVTGQNLVSRCCRLTDEAVPGKEAMEIPLQRLMMARPDLRERVLSTYPGARLDATVSGFAEPILLPSGVYRKLDESISVHSLYDTDSLPDWRWLEADLTTGHEFTLPLAPGLANDIFLHARVLGRKRVTIPSGSYSNVVEVLYAIDYGIIQIFDSDGNVLGFARTYLFGSIAYAPNVGPIRSREHQSLLKVDALPDVQTVGTVDFTLEHRMTP